MNLTEKKSAVVLLRQKN